LAIAVSILSLAISASTCNAEENAAQETATQQAAQAATARTTAAEPAPPKLPEPKGAQRLSPEYDVWIDPKEKTVIVDGQISLREGMLEMFACTRNTKEHESIVSANTRAFLVHAALVRLGAEPGHPAQFVPEYKPPAGTEIDVVVHWLDETGKPHQIRAQEWVKDVRTDQAMKQPWVFAGSRFWKDQETGTEYYQAEGGDFICVSNFGTAMLDIPIESSQSNQELAFAAFTERIPPLGAPVRLILKPKLKEPGTKGSQREAANEKEEIIQPTGGSIVE
jgi:hypothetical protein